MKQWSMVNYSKLIQHEKKGKIKRVCASLRLKKCERMSVSCEVIGAGFVQ